MGTTSHSPCRGTPKERAAERDEQWEAQQEVLKRRRGNLWQSVSLQRATLALYFQCCIDVWSGRHTAPCTSPGFCPSGARCSLGYTARYWFQLPEAEQQSIELLIHFQRVVFTGVLDTCMLYSHALIILLQTPEQQLNILGCLAGCRSTKS